jgi:phosphate:Na+ symporter
MTELEILKEKANDNERMLNQGIDKLIRDNKIDPKMAASLINDVGFMHSICKKLLKVAAVLWVKDKEIAELGDEYEY